MKNQVWIISFLLLAACSNTRITSSWKNNHFTPSSYQKILVVAMIPDNERNIQQAMEKSMVDELHRKGYEAVSAFQEFGPRAFPGLTEAALLAKVRGDNADALITISQTNHTRSKSYVPGTLYPSPWGWGWGWGGGYYSPGYIRNDSHYSWETNFYDVATTKTVYSVQSRTFDPRSAYNLAEGYSRQIVRDMRDKGVLIKQRSKDVADK